MFWHHFLSLSPIVCYSHVLAPFSFIISYSLLFSCSGTIFFHYLLSPIVCYSHVLAPFSFIISYSLLFSCSGTIFFHYIQWSVILMFWQHFLSLSPMVCYSHVLAPFSFIISYSLLFSCSGTIFCLYPKHSVTMKTSIERIETSHPLFSSTQLLHYDLIQKHKQAF